MRSIVEIMKYLPHRYPFLLVDRVEEVSAEKILAIKNVTINEPFFQGHFPNDPIMPGVLLVEGMAQCAGLIVFMGENVDISKLSFYFTGIEKVKFRKAVRPGDRLEYHVELLQRSNMMSKFKGQVLVDGSMACAAEFSGAVVEIPKS